jgi:hypothetical protein
VFDTPDHPELGDISRWFNGWLKRSQFAYHFFGDWWLDGDGRVTAT